MQLINNLKFNDKGLIPAVIVDMVDNRVLTLLGYLLYPLVSPFVYFFPNRAGGMTCLKCLTED